MKIQIILSLTFVAILQSTFAAVTPKYEDVFVEFPGEVFLPIQNETSNYHGPNYAADIGNANKYLDDLLKEAGSTFRANNIDPLSLPDVDKSFEKKVWFVTLYGGFRAYNGKLEGLATLHRAGDATLDSTRSDYTTIKATLAVNGMWVGTDAKAWFGKASIGWHMASTIKYLKCTITLHVPNKPKAKPKAVFLEINEIGTIYVHFKNLGPLNLVLDGVGFLITNMFKNSLKLVVAGPILRAINSAIPNLPGLGF